MNRCLALATELLLRSRSARRRRQRWSVPALVQVLDHRRLLSGITITVTTFSDAETAGQTTLRDAVTQANNDTGNSDTIAFASSLFPGNTPGTITLTQGAVAITNSMVITGPGANLLTISGNGSSQIFIVDDGNVAVNDRVAITGLTLTLGSTSSTTIADKEFGGAIFNAETLTLSNDTISHSSGSGGGGGVYNSGTLTSTHDTFSGNTALDSQIGGGVCNTGTLTSANDTFSGNSAGLGGGVGNDYGTMTSINDTFSSNDAYQGLESSGGGGGGIGNIGPVLTSTNDTFANNSAAGGGGVANQSGSIMTSTNDTFSGNSATNNIDVTDTGGGIYNDCIMTVINDTIAGNFGGGVVNAIGGTWNSLNTIVAGNFTIVDLPSDMDAFSVSSVSYTLIGDANSTGGITNGDGNIVGVATTAIFVTDGNGIPVLANNGGPTETIALNTGSRAIGAGGPLTTLSAPIAAATSTLNIPATVASPTFLAVGDFLQIDSEIVQVVSLSGGNPQNNIPPTSLTIARGQDGTIAASHAANTAISLAFDQRGVPRTSHDLGATGNAVDSLPPVLSGIGGTVTDAAPATPIALAPNLVITDSVNLNSTTVSFANWQVGDRLQFTNPFALRHTFVTDDTANTATLTFTGIATAAQYQSTLRSLQFWTVAGRPVTWLQRVATFTVNDIDSNRSSGTQDLQFNSVAPPALSGIGTTVSDFAPSSPITVAPSLVIADSLNLSSATVSFTNWQVGDRLQFANAYALRHAFVADDATNTATLTFTGVATTAEYQTTLRSLRFWTVAVIPVTWLQRVATFTVNDIYANSGSGTQNIQFNPVSTVDPPVVSGINGLATYVELAPPVTIAPNLRITDNVNISSATVSFVNWQVGDRIQFSNAFALQHTFVENDTNNTASLTITGFATAAQYQTTLQSMQFWNVAANPVTSVQRIATFTVDDIYGNAGSGTRNLQFDRAAPPALSGIGTTVSDVAPSSPITVAPNLVIADSLNVSSATVSFANWQAGDRLQFANSYALQHTFVADDTATLTLTGVATAAEYQTTLRSLRFWTVAAIPVTWLQRVATFTVNDIDGDSGSGTQNIQFNPVSTVAPPVVSGVDGLATYIELAPPVTIAPNLMITDNLNISSATVSFVNWQIGDRIQFSNAFALQHTFVENDANNTASLTITGFATAAQYQTTLRSLQFWNVAANPVTSVQRVATFTVDDIYGNTGSGSQNMAVS